MQDVRDNCKNIQENLAKIHKRDLMTDIKTKYNKEEYVWYNFEAACEDWYMDSCHFWDDNSIPHYVEHIRRIFKNLL
jgi:hypothetical protein